MVHDAIFEIIFRSTFIPKSQYSCKDFKKLMYIQWVSLRLQSSEKFTA